MIVGLKTDEYLEEEALASCTTVSNQYALNRGISGRDYFFNY